MKLVSLIWADIWKFIFICFQQLIWADTGSNFKATKSCLLYTFIVFNSSGFYERYSEASIYVSLWSRLIDKSKSIATNYLSKNYKYRNALQESSHMSRVVTFSEF